MVAALWPLASRRGPSWWVRGVRVAAADLRDGVLSAETWPGVTAASIVVVAGHAATFVIAARVAGSTASLAQLLPLALVVLLAMGLPINIGGWGPREGAAAWAFGAAGLGRGAGRQHRGRLRRAGHDCQPSGGSRPGRDVVA